MSESLVDWGVVRVATGDWRDGARQARVVRVDRGECDVMTFDGRVRVLSDSQRAQGEIAPVTGDWVEIEDIEGLGAVIARVLPRRTAVSRRDPAEKDLEQVLASNVDVVAAVLGLDRPVQAGWLERLLVMAIDSGAEPLIVLTKADEADVDTPAFSIVEAVAGSVPVIVTSVVDRTGLDELLARIGAERTLALVGESGVGKSSIVNALVGEQRLEVGEVRASDAEGRHTTTARELIRLPGGAGLILDTPGIRTLGLWEAEHAVDLVFGDLVELAEHCRFGDCAHRGEPGCAVQAAIDTGDVPAMRVRLFLELVAELDNLRKREEQRVRREKGGGRRRR
ncbi:MAG TPA: ribosome small subunit-dependent GTPase A [Acidimicrobiaceae bacterium]|nr:ribosome small subunit-dependent GTPase A [Acidimicrobiaceae bacterium]